ncbi:MAG: ROK family protein [Syntrophobacterales bacterium]|jgi:glucokinase|nr:ROK family protein [Syntrophobacterales bacterium]
MRIGVDIGGTKIAGGLIDKGGRIVAKRKVPTDPQSGYVRIVEKIVGLIDGIIGAAGAARGQIERVGIACAGQIEKHSQMIVVSPNLGFHDAPLKDDIERATGVATSIENDANAAVYGEWKFGLGGKPSNVLGVFMGTGIGGGFIMDGKLYRGFLNVGGEIGHMTLNPHGYPCRCGSAGCFEAFCGGYHIVERVKRLMRQGYRGKIWQIIRGDMAALNAGHVEEAYLEGDELCGRIWEEVVEYMGVGLASLVNMLNPEIVILGGGVVFGTRHIVDQAREVILKRAMAGSVAGLQLRKASLGEDAAILGAAFVGA